MSPEQIAKIVWERHIGEQATHSSLDMLTAVIKEAIELHEASKPNTYELIRRIADFADPKGSWARTDKESRLEAIHSLICFYRSGQYAPEVE